MANIPAPLTYGRVIWLFGAIGGDGPDDDQIPDLYPVTGTVTFTPQVKVARGNLVEPRPMTFVARSVNCTIVDGVLLGEDGKPGVSLLATESPGITPSPIQWVVVVSLQESNVNIDPFYINVPARAGLVNGDYDPLFPAVDLTNYVSVDAVQPIVQVVSEETRVKAEAAALRAETAAGRTDEIVQGLLSITEAPTRVGYTSAYGLGLDSITLEPDQTMKVDHWARVVFVLTNPTRPSVPVTVTAPPTWETLTISRLPQTTVYILRHKVREGENRFSFAFSDRVNVNATIDWISGAADAWDIGPVTLRDIANTNQNFAAPVIARRANNMVTTFSIENTAALEAAPSSIAGAAMWYYQGQVGAVTGTILSAISNKNLAGPTVGVTVTYPNPAAGEGVAVQMAIPGAPYNQADPWGRTLVYVEKEGVPIPQLPAGTPIVSGIENGSVVTVVDGSMRFWTPKYNFPDPTQTFDNDMFPKIV